MPYIYSLPCSVNGNPFISICVPAYKRPGLMRRLLVSVLEQSYKDYELIVTDDSPDSSVEELVKTFSQLPLRYFKNEPAAGTPGNWNLAMQKATAPWIQVLHADDWYASPDALAKFAAVCSKSSSSFVFCASSEVDKEGRTIKDLRPSPAKLRLLQEDPLYLVYDNMIGHPSVVLHKRDSGLQYNNAYKWVVDIDLYIRFLEKHPSFEYISDPLINIGIDEEQVSATAYKNPVVEIPEYLQLISSLPEQDRLANRYVFQALWTLVKKFRIKDWSYIREQGYTGDQMEVVDFIIHYQKRIPRFVLKQTGWSAILVKKCYATWLKKSD